MIVWICGQWVSQFAHWELQGIFSNEDKAIAACQTSLYFIAPIEIDKECPRDNRYMPGAYYPLAEGMQ